jgi:aldose sugar dehydrogenase
MQHINGAGRIARPGWMLATGILACIGIMGSWLPPRPAGVGAQALEPEIVVPNLAVRTVVSGLVTPISLAFLGPDDMFVLEKNTGRVQRIVSGKVDSTVLDLAVNFASERGLLGIALHPDFPTVPWVYLYWTESTTGADTDVLSETPLLGNRVDRFVWNGRTLTLDTNLIRLRALQPLEPPEVREFGNHDGGVLRFGPDGKLYIFIGDVGRRGWMQNLPCGPADTCPGPTVPDDQFGGPEPDDAHLTGVILRINEDGTTPSDNPFFAAGAEMVGEVGANIQKIFSYGHRNSFGMAFDPYSGHLWLQENGDDSFSEINRVEPGMNGGWVQIMGPVDRIDDYKAIETSPETDPVTGTVYLGLQQERWPPALIADSPEEALSRLFMLPGAHYRDPELSWRFVVEPGGLGFIVGRALGPQFDGHLVLGAARTFLEDGFLFRLRLTGNRRSIAGRRVIENNHKWDITGSETLLFGRNFGIGTDVQTGPNGNLFVVSLTKGALYEIHRVHPGRRASPAPGEAAEGVTELLLEKRQGGAPLTTRSFQIRRPI